ASKLKLFTLTQYSKEKLLAFAKVHHPVFQSPPAKAQVAEARLPAKAQGQLAIADHEKSRPVLSVLILTLFFALMVPLSSAVVRFFDPAEKTLIVNFKYISTPQAYEQGSSAA